MPPVDAGAGPEDGDPYPPPDDGQAEEEEDEDPLAGLPPDHPLLARAQAALRDQLQATRDRLAEELRQQAETLRVSRRRGATLFPTGAPLRRV